MSAEQDGVPGLQEQVDPYPIHLYLILDVSPSMATRWPQTVSGLNEYVSSLRKDKEEDNQSYKVTMVTFSSEVKEKYKEVDLDSIPTFTEKNLSRHGSGTALYDAIQLTVKDINTTEPVLVVVITDGEENSSRTYTSKSVDTLFEERKKLGNYTFAYLGVDKEAWGQEAAVKSFAASNHNVAGDNYNTAFYSNLGETTRTYSRAMRQAGVMRSSMQVDNLFDPDTKASPKTTNIADLTAALDQLQNTTKKK